MTVSEKRERARKLAGEPLELNDGLWNGADEKRLRTTARWGKGNGDSERERTENALSEAEATARRPARRSLENFGKIFKKGLALSGVSVIISFVVGGRKTSKRQSPDSSVGRASGC